MDSFRKLGVETLGAEYAKSALAFCKKRGLNVLRFDFTNPSDLEKSLGKFDLALSTEVVISIDFIVWLIA